MFDRLVKPYRSVSPPKGGSGRTAGNGKVPCLRLVATVRTQDSVENADRAPEDPSRDANNDMLSTCKVTVLSMLSTLYLAWPGHVAAKWSCRFVWDILQGRILPLDKKPGAVKTKVSLKFWDSQCKSPT